MGAVTKRKTGRHSGRRGLIHQARRAGSRGRDESRLYGGDVTHDESCPDGGGARLLRAALAVVVALSMSVPSAALATHRLAQADEPAAEVASAVEFATVDDAGTIPQAEAVATESTPEPAPDPPATAALGLAAQAGDADAPDPAPDPAPGGSSSPSSSDPTDPADPGPQNPGAPEDPSPQDPQEPETPTAPGELAPANPTLPAAQAGKAYWDTAADEPLVTFKAEGTPSPAYALKDLPATTVTDPQTGTQTTQPEQKAQRKADSQGSFYWEGAGLPEGLRLYETSGEIDGAPASGVQGQYEKTYEFTVVASNGTLPNSERAYTLTVADDAYLVEQATVPDLSNMTQSTAVRKARAAGFSYRVVQQPSDLPAGEVLAQDPAAGATADKGSTITITVSSGPADEPEAPQVKSLDLYAYFTNAAGDYVARIGNNGRELGDDGSWQVPSTLWEKGQRIRLCAAIARSDGSAFYQNESDWPSDVSVTWQSSNPMVASVTSQGVVVATGDGTATITATATGGVQASIKVRVVGQSGAFPVMVEVIDDQGVPYGDERVTFSQIDSTNIHFYARVTFSDLSTASNCPAAFDYDPDNETIKTLSWSTSNTEKGYVNQQTGVFIPRGYATMKVFAKVTGGDPLIDGGQVEGYVWVVVDSGVYDESNPSDTLHVRVTYQEDEEYTAAEADFTVNELRAIESAYATYTYTKAEGEYVTASGCGIYLTTLLRHIGIEEGAENGIDPDDVYGMRLAANDGVNPGLITADFMFQPRYWFPNYEFGGNMVGAQNVFAMLAYESDWRDSARGATASGADYSALDGGTRFRLLFGSLSTADGTTSKSLRYINTITLILKGAPPAKPEEPEEEQTSGGDAGTSGGKASPTGGEGTSSNATTEGTGAASVSYGLQANAVAGGSSGEQVADAATDADATATQNTPDPTGDGGAYGDNTDTPNDFHVYQMMSNPETILDYQDWENPYLPWVLPLVLACAAAGAGMCWARYREQLAPTTKARPA